jgi:hypothetical protein
VSRNRGSNGPPRSCEYPARGLEKRCSVASSKRTNNMVTILVVISPLLQLGLGGGGRPSKHAVNTSMYARRRLAVLRNPAPLARPAITVRGEGVRRMRMRMRMRIGNPTVPGQSYHLDLCHQVPESDSTFPRDRSRERRRGDSEETQARYFAKNRHVGRAGAGSTRRPGCGGRLDRVTGVGSPAHRLVKLEVRLGLGDWIGRREQLGFALPGRRPTRGGL